MSKPLWLTADEKKHFDALPSSLKEGWESKAETQDAYETQAALEMRVELSSFRKNPELKKLAERVAKGESPEKLTLPDLSDEEIGDFFFCIGARGMSAFIDVILKAPKSDDDLMALQSIAQMRHDLLETNSSISYL